MIFRESRRHPASLADLLNWAVMVDDGVVLNKDGSLLAGWHYRGPDLFSATDEEIELLSTHLNRALLPLGSDWMLSVDAVRRRAASYPDAGERFPDPVTRLLDEERRAAYLAHHTPFESSFTLLLTQITPPDLEAHASRWLVRSEAADRATDYRHHLTQFQRALDDFEDLFGARFWTERLDSEGLLSHLHFCLTGLDHPVKLPANPCYLDALLASDDFTGGFEPRIGERRIAVLGLTGLPLSSTPALLDFLNHLPLAYRWSSRWIPLDPEQAERAIRRHRRNWWQKRRGLVDFLRDLQARSPHHRRESQGFSNRDAVAMAEDADQALAEASSQAVRFGYYTPAIVLIEEDEQRLRDHARALLRELRNHGLPARLETVNAVEAFRGSLPGHGWSNVRRPLIHTGNLAHLLPTTAVYSGAEHNPSPYFPEESPALLWAATGTTPFRLHLHSGDVGHTLLIGPTGSGKSTLLNLLAAQFFRYKDAQVFVFDKGFSAFPLVEAAGGDAYDIAGERVDALAFTPLAGIDDPRERAWAAEWLEGLFELQGLPLSPQHREELHEALRRLAGLTSRTITALRLQLQDEELRTAIGPYTIEGPMGALLDAEDDALRSSRFQVFEVSHLMELRDPAVVPVLLYLFHRIDQRLTGRPTLLVLDEAWTFLLHGVFARRIQTWLKELRKKNAAVVFATQSLADVRASEHRYLLYESCPTKILLPNAEALGEHVRDLYREIGLNDREIRIVAEAVPKRDYYVAAPEGRRLIDLHLGPLALAFLGAGDTESLKTIRSLVDTDGAAWPAAWLRHKGLEPWAERLTPHLVRKEMA